MLSAIDCVCLTYFIKLGFRVIVFPSFPAGGECPWGEHTIIPRVFKGLELHGYCLGPPSLRVVLTPLNGN